MTQFPWEDGFAQALRRGDGRAALQLLEARATAHAGTPTAAAKRRALHLIQTQGEEHAWSLAQAWAESASPTANELAAILLADQFTTDPDRASHWLHRLADHPNWEVREWAASGCGLVLRDHFNAFYPVVWEWARTPGPNVRRAVALAAMYAGRGLPESHAELLLDLLEPLLFDRDPYVKKNLGPFVLGSGLLARFPQPTLARLEAWAGSPDETVCWNVAMAFTAAAARPYASAGLRILTKLQTDPRPSVRRAVQSATRKLLAAK